MALAERFQVVTRPVLSKGGASGAARLAIAAIAIASAVALIVRIFALGYPIVAVWLAAAFCAWAFIFGAGRASDGSV